jgi:hypothetical protein
MSKLNSILSTQLPRARATLPIHDAKIDADGRLAHELAEQYASTWPLSTRPSNSWKMSQPIDIHT